MASFQRFGLGWSVLSATCTAAVLSLFLTSASGADLGGPADDYGMTVPHVRSDMAYEGYAPVGLRHKIRRPSYGASSPGDYGNGYPGYVQDDPMNYSRIGEPSDVYPPDSADLNEPLPPRPGHCLAALQIQNLLMRQGWRDFSGPQNGVDVVGLTARRPNGLTYRLKLDRCTGILIQSYLLDQPDRQRTYSDYGQDGQPPGY